MKIFRRVLRNRLENEYTGIKEQCDFSAGRSCIEHIFMRRHILEKRRDKGISTELVFVDLEKVYENVPRILLWNSLKIDIINETLIN